MKKFLGCSLPALVLLLAAAGTGRADQFTDIQNSPNTYWVPVNPGYASAPPAYGYPGGPGYYYGPPPVPPPPPIHFFFGFHFH